MLHWGPFFLHMVCVSSSSHDRMFNFGIFESYFSKSIEGLAVPHSVKETSDTEWFLQWNHSCSTGIDLGVDCGASLFHVLVNFLEESKNDYYLFFITHLKNFWGTFILAWLLLLVLISFDCWSIAYVIFSSVHQCVCSWCVWVSDSSGDHIPIKVTCHFT